MKQKSLIGWKKDSRNSFIHDINLTLSTPQSDWLAVFCLAWSLLEIIYIYIYIYVYKFAPPLVIDSVDKLLYTGPDQVQTKFWKLLLKNKLPYWLTYTVLSNLFFL